MAPRVDLSADLPGIIEFRHDLHRHPELGYQEFRTTEKISQKLSEIGVEHRANVAGGTGVVAFLPATVSGGRCIGLRADIDALPIQEQTGLPYASVHEGKMHACGHDGHTAILLGAIQSLAKEFERPNDLIFIFQPAEEGGAGAKAMVDAGAINGGIIGRKVDMMFGLHVMPNRFLGNISTRKGPFMASATGFQIHIEGRGAHAATPQLGIDPVLVGSELVIALQTVASRSIAPVDPVVVTIGQFLAGVAHNVIPETASLKGTLRTLDDLVNDIARERIDRIAYGIAYASGAKIKVAWGENPYPVVHNHPEATDVLRQCIAEDLGEEHLKEEIEPAMFGEDFSFYGKEVPSCFFYLGLHESGTAALANLHHPEFRFNDDAIPVGIRAMRSVAFFR